MDNRNLNKATTIHIFGKKVTKLKSKKINCSKEKRCRFFFLKKEKYFHSKFFKLPIIVLFLDFILLNINKIERHNINSRNKLWFITCYFGVDKIKRNDRIRKYLYVLDKFVPYAKVIFGISEFTKIDPIITKNENIRIKIERFGNETKDYIRSKYKSSSRFYFNGMRYYFYTQYLKKHRQIKYVVISDDDTLFFRDPFPIIAKDPTVVHIMEDIYPFSVTKDFNYIWTNAWACLDKKIKEKCGFNHWNKSLSSDEFKNLIPLNCGLLIGQSKNIIKIVELISTRFICSGMFHNNAEQGLLNYLDLSGELKELGISIKRHNIYNNSFISCPELLPIENYIQQINSEHFIALHHYHKLKENYIEKTPNKFKLYLNKSF
jgi:hypothetical protein